MINNDELPPREVQEMANIMARAVLRWTQGDLPPELIAKRHELERAIENANSLAVLFNCIDVGAYRHVVGLVVDLEAILQGFNKRTLH